MSLKEVVFMIKNPESYCWYLFYWLIIRLTRQIL